MASRVKEVNAFLGNRIVWGYIHSVTKDAAALVLTFTGTRVARFHVDLRAYRDVKDAVAVLALCGPAINENDPVAEKLWDELNAEWEKQFE